MNGSSDRQDPTLLILIAIGVAVAVVVSSIGAWRAALGRLAGRPATVTLVVALVIFAVAGAVARLVFTRRARSRRSRLGRVPGDSFDPPAAAGVAFAVGMAATLPPAGRAGPFAPRAEPLWP